MVPDCAVTRAWAATGYAASEIAAVPPPSLPDAFSTGSANAAVASPPEPNSRREARGADGVNADVL